MISNEFKKQCSNTFQYSPYLGNIMQNLEKGYLNRARLYMDTAIDELQAVINQKIGLDEAPIHNGRVESLKEMYNCWYKLLDLVDPKEEKHLEI